MFCVFNFYSSWAGNKKHGLTIILSMSLEAFDCLSPQLITVKPMC